MLVTFFGGGFYSISIIAYDLALFSPGARGISVLSVEAFSELKIPKPGGHLAKSGTLGPL